MDSPRLPQLEDRAAPFTTRVTGYINAALWLLVASGPARAAWDVAVGVALASVASLPLRDGREGWARLGILASFFVVYLLIGAVGVRLFKSQKVGALLYGAPRFGELKGPGRRVFTFVLRCADAVDLRFDRDGARVAALIGRRDAVLAEGVFRREFDELGYDAAAWPEVWEKIRTTGVGGYTYGQAVLSSKFNLFAQRYVHVSRLTSALALIYVGGVLVLFRNSWEGGEFRPLVQFCLVAGFAIAATVFINYTTQLQRITVTDESWVEREIAEANPKFSAARLSEIVNTAAPGLQEQVAELNDTVLYPEIRLGPGYVRAVRNHFCHMFLMLGLWNSVVVSGCLLLQWPISRAYSSWTADEVRSWTLAALAVAWLCPIALSLTVALGLILVSNLRWMLAIAASAAIPLVLPFLLSYIFGVPSSLPVTTLSLVSTIASSVLVGLAERLKDRPSHPAVGPAHPQAGTT